MKIFNFLFVFLFFILINTIYPQLNIEDLCGPDNRVASNYKAVGRIYTQNHEVGTCWILSDGRLVTAAHVLATAGNGTYIEFNVPPSEDCITLGRSTDSYKYTINWSTLVQPSNYSLGNDWVIFKVNPNSITGLTPIEKQGAYFFVEQTNTPGNIQVIGFGSSSNCSMNYAQQSGTGSYYGLNGTIVEYTVDATSGNSGSPVINMTTGKVIGIHTDGTCGSLGYNKGTSTYNSSFWSALHLPPINVTLNERLSNGTSVGTIGRWQGSSFSPRQSPGSSISTPPGSIEAIQADQATYSGEKFNNWNRNDRMDNNVANHHLFPVQDVDLNYSANFLPTYAGITIQNNFPELSYNPANSLVGLSDPWLIDYPDPDYGNIARNEGMAAPFREQTSPFSPDLSSSFNGYVYKGLFLNQGFVQGQWKAPYYSVSFPNQDISIGGVNHTPNLWYWTGTNAVFKYPNSSQTPVVFTNSNAVATANIKFTQLSSDATAYTNNSQRKIVKTTDGWLHQVYSSMNRVWIEHSSNGGTTWFLGNNGQPLDGAAGGKNPSIDWWYDSMYNKGYLIIAFQQQYGSHYQIRCEFFRNDNGMYNNTNSGRTLHYELTDSYSVNSNPNITWGEATGKFALTFERKGTDTYGRLPGIYWIYGDLNQTGMYPHAPTSPQYIPNTDANSINAAVSLKKSAVDSDGNFDVVYEQYSSGASTIKDAYLQCYWGSDSWNPSYISTESISTSSGYKNYKPSMVQLSNNNIKVCWIRDLYGGGSNTPNYVNVVYWSSTSPNTFNYYGNMVNSVSLNIKDNSDDTYFAYAQKTNNSNWQNFARNGSGTVTLSTTGRQIQLSNGPSSTAMYASAYYPVSAPYYFQTLSLPAGLSKSSGEINYGRGLYLSKDELQFNYSVKSLKVDNAGIQFVEIPENTDTNKSRRVKYLELDELNKMLLSEPFSISASSDFAFCDDAGFIGKEAAEQLLGKNGNIVCKIELIEDATNKTLGLINETVYSSENLPQGKISNYTLNTEGLKNTMARVKITISSNVEDLKGVFVSEYGTLDKGSLAKASATELTLQKDGVITEYALEQNYPNPFNPSTTIKYQIPENGMVTLKIFNILGEEVATLVNDFKTTGRYEVKFDASNLASGVYVYRLSAGDFNASHKMLLLK